ncbi:MAG: M23 family metallopeptidase, partial [Pseudomonadota bacterium]
SVQIKSGQSLASTLGQQKISPAKIEQIARSLAPHFNLRKLRPGDIVHGFMRTNDDTGDDTGTSLYKLELVPARSASGQAKRSYLAVLQSPGRFDVVTVLKPLLSSTRLVEQSIDLSLLYTMELAGIHQGVAAAFADIFAFDIDFQRDIHPGDRFSILFEERRDPDTGKIIGGTIKRAELEVRKQARIYYPFKLESSRIAYFDSKGNSARRALLKTPIAAGRLSSGYGMRKHPILGYNRMHRGVDFAAPRGTPIFAAGDGTVEMVGRSGGYGKLIRIRHNGSYKTVYAHMSRFAKGMRRGKRVQQGQVIGYVGSTGMSTGPHLHYEIVLNGKQINPSTLKLAHSRKIPAATMDAFEQSRLDIERQFALLQESNPGGPDGESVQLATGSVPASDDPGQ